MNKEQEEFIELRKDTRYIFKIDGGDIIIDKTDRSIDLDDCWYWIKDCDVYLHYDKPYTTGNIIFINDGSVTIYHVGDVPENLIFNNTGRVTLIKQRTLS